MTTPSPDKLEIPEAAVEPTALSMRIDDGLSCYCGGGWLLGHASGCPEAEDADTAELHDRLKNAYDLGRTHEAQRLPHMPDRGYAEVAPTHRHKKRGSEYVLLGFGKMQAENWTRPVHLVEGGDAFEITVDMDEVAIYRSVDDGSLWVRPREEFEDGRFEALIAPPAPADNGEPATHDEESILDVISGNLRMESWVAGKTLTVMFDTESGERRFAKLRLTKIAAQPSPADLKGEPE